MNGKKKGDRNRKRGGAAGCKQEVNGYGKLTETGSEQEEIKE